MATTHGTADRCGVREAGKGDRTVMREGAYPTKRLLTRTCNHNVAGL